MGEQPHDRAEGGHDEASGRWSPSHGLITKVVVWLILIGIAATVLAMLAILIFDPGG